MISVALATYNGEKYLREQLDSLFQQTLLPDEVIVSDDLSTDSTIEILEEYASIYGLKYYLNQGDHGVNGNFYNAFSHCHGDYICICDQDDIWLPTKIEVLYKAISSIPSSEFAMVSSRAYDIDANGNRLGNEIQYHSSFGYVPTFLSTGTSQGCTIIMNRRLCDYVLSIKDSPSVLDLIYDALIAFSASMIGVKVNLGDKLMLYRHHSSNVICKYKDPSMSKRFDIMNYWRLYGFMPDDRPKAILDVYQVCSPLVTDSHIHDFINTIRKLHEKRSLIGQLLTVCTIKELSVVRKFKIVASSIFLSFVKLFQK